MCYWPNSTEVSAEAMPSFPSAPNNGGIILCGSHNHDIYCLTVSGKLLWSFTTQSEVYATPFVFTLCRSCSSTPTVALSKNPKCVVPTQCDDCRTLVCVCCTTGYLYILDIVNGRLLTSHQVDGELFSSPVVYKDSIVVGCRDDNVYCFNVALETRQLL